jgi:hypothetical protein
MLGKQKKRPPFDGPSLLSRRTVAQEYCAEGTMEFSTTFLLIHWSVGATRSMFDIALSRQSVVQPQHFHS